MTDQHSNPTDGRQPNLPPGQRAITAFPRFGLPTFSWAMPRDVQTLYLRIGGDVARDFIVDEQLRGLERVEQRADFHCVTGWSSLGHVWSGFRFRDFYRLIVQPAVFPQTIDAIVVFTGRDGYRAALPLVDLLADNVMLADHLDGERLGMAHGGALRLVAPAHYGYKNVKHLEAVECWNNPRRHRFPLPYPGLMEHPRARVAYEERGRHFPAWVFRWLYRPLITPTIVLFRITMRRARARAQRH